MKHEHVPVLQFKSNPVFEKKLKSTIACDINENNTTKMIDFHKFKTTF